MTNLIVSLLGFLTDTVTNVLPKVSLGDGVLQNAISAFSYFVDMIANINWLVPVDDALLIIGITVGYRVTMFIIFIVNWVIRRVFDVIP